MAKQDVPTLYEWIGGLDALRRLMRRFYEHVAQDPLLAPVFAHMEPDHSDHVAAFLAEVLGGPTVYLERGSRLAVINSQPGAMVDEHAAMPKWGWGRVKGAV